jgi:hypothetical protein
MKTLVTALLLLVSLQLGRAADIPKWSIIKESKRGAKMIRIVEAIFEYSTNHEKMPPTLYSLVAEDFLKERDLCLENMDGSLSVPEYFPGLSFRSRGDEVVIRAPSKDRAYQIVVRLDQSISGLEYEKQRQNKAEEPTPNPPSD